MNNGPNIFPLVSVIVPVYNVEKYLRECVNSITSQTYKNIEIILSDDGSTDNSGSMCDEIAREDHRIKVIHEKNGGLSIARNRGLDVMTGDYFMFVDSDDMIHPLTIERMMNIATKNDDISIVGTHGLKSSVSPYWINNSELKDDNVNIYTGVDIIRRFLLNKDGCSSCSKLYNRKHTEDIRFTEKIQNEDAVYLAKIYSKSVAVAITDNVYYFYRSTIGSMSRKFSIKHLDVFKNSFLISDIISLQPYDTSVERRRYQTVAAIDCCMYLYKNGQVTANKELYQEYKSFLKKDFLKKIFLSKLSVRQRLKYILALVN